VQLVEAVLKEKQKAKPGLVALSSAVGSARSGKDLFEVVELAWALVDCQTGAKWRELLPPPPA
jgi:hypothetical protein